MPLSISCSLSSQKCDEKPVIAVKIVPTIQSAVRRPFHLVLLLDTSASMTGNNIESVIRTLHLLIDAMKSNDIITLIRYSSDARIVAEAVVMNDESRTNLHNVANELHADGGTNLESAFVSLREVHNNPKIPTIDSVFVMTDGHINQGIASSTGLMRILASGVPAGTPVNTLGYGSDHHIILLRDIAVRSRGSYTYADSNEVIPAVIGDIMGGLASEVGRNGQLTIPTGWRCLEFGVEDTDLSYSTGTLIADKPQWIVLEGPVGGVTTMPIEFRWSCCGVEHTEVFTITTDIPPIEVLEQQHRAHVATVFGNVTQHIESMNYVEAKACLEELASFLEASAAKERPFVIQMRAQVDDMLESMRPSHIMSASLPMIGLPLPRGGARRQTAVCGYPSMGSALSRLASNTAALGVQRGFMSGGTADPDSLLTGLHAAFSSPMQREVSHGFTQNYTQIHDPIDVMSTPSL